jgi:cyanophycinase
MNPTGTILLAGGAEFGGAMAEADREAIRRAGGMGAAIRIVPTAAAPDHNDKRAGANGVRWFRQLGAQNVAVVPVIDRASANNPQLAQELQAAQLIYLLGGFPHYLAETLKESLAWQAMRAAYEGGAVLGGSSAGAMVLCSSYFHPERRLVQPGLGLVPNLCVLPHHNTFGASWVTTLVTQIPDTPLLGIDEATAWLRSGDGPWQVYGPGAITLYRRGNPTVITMPTSL